MPNFEERREEIGFAPPTYTSNLQKTKIDVRMKMDE